MFLERNRFARRWSQRRARLRGEKLRLLIVDDNHDGAEALAAYLAFEDMDCRVAFGGLEAIETALAWTPHVIIMDISMPGCDGFDAARALRKSPRTSDTTIVAFTALDEAHVRERARDAEFDGYCQKGQPPSVLIALVEEMVN